MLSEIGVVYDLLYFVRTCSVCTVLTFISDAAVSISFTVPTSSIVPGEVVAFKLVEEVLVDSEGS